MTSGERFRDLYEREFEPETPAEAVLVDRVVALLDQIERMEARLEADGYIATGGNGQAASHPLLASIRAHSAEVSRLVRQLRMEPESIASIRARRAAQARWESA